MQYIELGGPRAQGVAITGSPATVDAANYLEREIDWPNVGLDVEALALVEGAVPLGGSLVIELWTVVAGVPSAVAVDGDAITSTSLTAQALTIPRAAAKTKYRLRATVTDADGLEALFFGVIQLEAEDAAISSPCATLRTAVANQAIGYLGITDQLVDVETDDRVEAQQARLHLDACLDQVLRAFPWGFATAYADLAWVAGAPDEPVNKDWAYAYRLPSDCVFARRLVQPGLGRRADLNPPDFREGARDETGPLLHSNYADPESDDPEAPTVHLEYTQRASCVLEGADALFTEALAWLLAHKLAPALSKNKVTAGDCWGKYQAVVGEARAASANEKQEPKDTGNASWIADR